MECVGNLFGKKGRDCIAHLDVLLGAISLEEIIVRERLDAGGLPDGKAATLLRVGMNEVVPILGDVTGYGRCRTHP